MDLKLIYKRFFWLFIDNISKILLIGFATWLSAIFIVSIPFLYSLSIDFILLMLLQKKESIFHSIAKNWRTHIVNGGLLFFVFFLFLPMSIYFYIFYLRSFYVGTLLVLAVYLYLFLLGMLTIPLIFLKSMSMKEALKHAHILLILYWREVLVVALNLVLLDIILLLSIAGGILFIPLMALGSIVLTASLLEDYDPQYNSTLFNDDDRTFYDFWQPWRYKK